MSKSSKVILVVLIITILVSAAIWIVLNYTSLYQKKEIAKLEKKIELLKQEFVPIRFKILEKNENLMKVAVKFYDSEGNVINKNEFELDGSELSFDFLTLKIEENKYISFPYKIYTDEVAPADGISLFGFYDINGFPQIFFEKDMKSENSEALKNLFTTLKAGKTTENNEFGNMVHDIKDVKSYNINQIYKIVCRVKGGIEVIEE